MKDQNIGDITGAAQSGSEQNSMTLPMVGELVSSAQTFSSIPFGSHERERQFLKKPKHPVSTYAHFIKIYGAQFRKENPTIKDPSKVFKLLGEQ